MSQEEATDLSREGDNHYSTGCGRIIAKGDAK
jgi:hypothetical protein